ncbi:uncharacterized protein LOC134534195 [Bacillus rossius redtenbacheri]|uniref:uncharacterized protein LOC134534195 n=1 Tax=Bacillus rossius redtenbacheri TaxID=93214 RepID=UPI002FDC8568
MTEYNSRHLKRIERKRKKMAAYLAVAAFNDQERKSTRKEQKRAVSAEMPEEGQSAGSKKPKAGDGEASNEVDDCDPHLKWIECEPTPEVEGPEAVAEFQRLKKLLNARKQLRGGPSFRLNAVGNEACLTSASRVPLLTADVRNLLMFTLLGLHSPYSPRWCVLEKSRHVTHAVALVIEGLTLYDFFANESLFPNVCAKFPNRVEVVVPSQYSGNLVRELAIVPLATVFRKELIAEYGNLAAAEKELCYGFPEARAMFPVAGGEEAVCDALPPADSFPRTKLLLSAVQLLEENYPLPLRGEMSDMYSHYVLSKDRYKEVTPLSPMFALDCEMCRTDTKQLELTRISVVNEKLEVVYDTLVKPHNRITDYLTRYSGVTAKMLADVTVRLADVQQKLREILPPDAILVGQSLNMDLHTLKMMHPYIIDTSIIFNVSGCRSSKSKLAALAYKFLNRSIQTSRKGHSPVEDSCASMELVQKKLSESVTYGDQILSRRMTVPEAQTSQTIADVIMNKLEKKKMVVVVATEAVAREYRSILAGNALGRDCSSAVRCVPAGSGEEVVSRACEVALEHALTIAQLSVPRADQAALRAVDEWCGQVHRHVAPRGLCLVLLGGRPAQASGACFVALKGPC